MTDHEKVKFWEHRDCVELIKSIGVKEGFTLSCNIEKGGVHFEKYHSPHYVQKGGINFEELERGNIYNFRKVK